MDYLQKIDDYLMLAEALNNPLPINWQTNNNSYIGEFIINNNTYVIDCKDLGDDVWFFSFDYIGLNNIRSNALTYNNKDVYRILPTIKEAFEHLYNTKNPNCIIFAIFDDSTGRRKIYDRFANEFSYNHKLNLLNKESNGKHIYSIYNNKIDKEYMSFVILKLIQRDVK